MRSFYIGIMTGNSMDAIDIVYASVSKDSIQPIYTLSVPFSADMQEKMAKLRSFAQQCQNRKELENDSFFQSVHDSYIQQVAEAVTQLIKKNKIDISSVKAVCAHGKTLDHLPPSTGNAHPYTLQIGSGKMLADRIANLLQREKGKYEYIRVIYDVRSDDIMNGGDGAPLIPPLNALIARQDNQPHCIDINAGNTANLCLIRNGEAVAGWDIGPCNEYMDYLVRLHTKLPFDKDGQIAKKGKLNKDLLKELFYLNASFYDKKPPKSGDPAYYGTKQIASFQEKEKLADNLYTCAYFGAYLTVFSLQFIEGEIPAYFSLFGGGWKHPILLQSLCALLHGKGEYLLAEHQAVFKEIYARLPSNLNIAVHPYGQWMESLLLARMGYCYDNKVAWTTPALTGCLSPTICGTEVLSDKMRTSYDDMICRAYKKG